MSDLAALRRVAAAALVASAVLPPDLVRNGPVLCTFRAVTGRPCPSCGMTRSWNAMAHGRLREASAYHLMGPITFVAGAALVALGDQRASRIVEEQSWARPVLGTIGAAWVVAWLWRLARGSHG